jgi:hypothetical protein
MDFLDKAELLRRLHDSCQRFNALLARLTPEQKLAPNVIGVWAVKDLLAHFIAHEQRALDQIHHALLGEAYHFAHECNDTFNEGAVLAYWAQSYADVYAAWSRSVEVVIAEVSRLNYADFDPGGRVVQLLDDTINGALANNTYEHWAEHGGQVEAWLRRQ